VSHLPNLKLPASPSPGEQLQLLKDFLRQGNELLKEQHLAGQSGLANCRNRSHFIDDLLKTLFQRASKETGHLDIALAAHGGYGRAYLNPGSDLDITRSQNLNVSSSIVSSTLFGISISR